MKTILRFAGVILLAATGALAAEKSPIPYKVWFNHDGTHILTNVKVGEKQVHFSEALFRDSIRELAGVGIDAVAFSPGNGVVPWWQSKTNDHWNWFTKRTGKEPGEVGRYIRGGGDLVKVFVEECRKHNLAPILTIRLKDEHHIENMDSEWVSKFFFEHQHWRLDPSPRAVFGMRGLNWIHPEVPEERLAVIRELAGTYDIEGIELDFMRHPPFFDGKATTFEQRQKIMTGFIKNVREILNETTPAGKTRHLAIRVPNRLPELATIGLDLETLDRERLVDIVNVSPSYVSQVESDLKEMTAKAPDAAFFYELTQASMRGPSPSWGAVIDDYPIRITTDDQFYTAANLAYARGAKGISLFNFTYTRPAARDGKFSIGGSIGTEPPYHIIKHLRDPQWLSKQPQNYWIPYWWKTGYHGRQFQLPKTFRVADKQDIKLDLALPKAVVKNGKLRIRLAGITPVLSATEPFTYVVPYQKGRAKLKWKASLNGQLLEETDDVAEPFDEPYKGFLGDPGDYVAWTVPASALRDGENTIQVELTDGPISDEFKIDIIWMDLGIFTEK
jgi:hypothetical protein